MAWELIGKTNELKSSVLERLLGVSRSERMWIPKGWLIRTVTVVQEVGVSVHHVTVDDPKHKWKLSGN